MSEELKPTNGKKLSDSVAQLIKEEIITNRIPPGERLFDEKDFLKTYKVSKGTCLLYTSPSPRDISGSRMPSSA